MWEGQQFFELWFDTLENFIFANGYMENIGLRVNQLYNKPSIYI